MNETTEALRCIGITFGIFTGGFILAVVAMIGVVFVFYWAGMAVDKIFGKRVGFIAQAITASVGLVLTAIMMLSPGKKR